MPQDGDSEELAAGLAVGPRELVSKGLGVGTGVSPGVALAGADGPALPDADGAADAATDQ